MVKVSEAKTEAQYQKEYDAQTLAEAEKIKADKTRLSGAKQAAKSMVAEQQKHTKALSKVAGTTSSRVASKAKTRANTPKKK